MDRRIAPALVAVLLALAAAVFPAGEPLAPAPPAQATADDGRVFFAMHIADEHGAVLAEPRLLGLHGVPLEMTLADPGNLEVPRMSLDDDRATRRKRRGGVSTRHAEGEGKIARGEVQYGTDGDPERAQVGART